MGQRHILFSMSSRISGGGHGALGTMMSTVEDKYIRRLREAPGSFPFALNPNQPQLDPVS